MCSPRPAGEGLGRTRAIGRWGASGGPLFFQAALRVAQAVEIERGDVAHPTAGDREARTLVPTARGVAEPGAVARACSEMKKTEPSP